MKKVRATRDLFFYSGKISVLIFFLVFTTCGIDAVLYLHFVKLCIMIMSAVTIVGVVFLIPLNMYGM